MKKKLNLWPLVFIGLFTLGLSMITWTIMSTQKANLDEDKSFLKSYQEVDAHFNEILYSNENFKKKYQLVFVLNDKEFNLTTEDIKYSQRVLEKVSTHKNILKVGENSLKLYIENINTKEKQNIDIELKVTKSNEASKDFVLTNDNFNNDELTFETKFQIPEENNWNITGSFELADEKGYLYIKTNAI